MDSEPQAHWVEGVGDSHGLGVPESHRDSSLPLLLFSFYQISLSDGILLPKPMRPPALDRESAFCSSCLSFLLPLKSILQYRCGEGMLCVSLGSSQETRWGVNHLVPLAACAGESCRLGSAGEQEEP